MHGYAWLCMAMHGYAWLCCLQSHQGLAMLGKATRMIHSAVEKLKKSPTFLPSPFSMCAIQNRRKRAFFRRKRARLLRFSAQVFHFSSPFFRSSTQRLLFSAPFFRFRVLSLSFRNVAFISANIRRRKTFSKCCCCFVSRRREKNVRLSEF